MSFRQQDRAVLTDHLMQQKQKLLNFSMNNLLCPCSLQFFNEITDIPRPSPLISKHQLFFLFLLFKFNLFKNFYLKEARSHTWDSRPFHICIQHCSHSYRSGWDRSRSRSAALQRSRVTDKHVVLRDTFLNDELKT